MQTPASTSVGSESKAISATRTALDGKIPFSPVGTYLFELHALSCSFVLPPGDQHAQRLPRPYRLKDTAEQVQFQATTLCPKSGGVRD